MNTFIISVFVILVVVGLGGFALRMPSGKEFWLLPEKEFGKRMRIAGWYAAVALLSPLLLVFLR